MRILFLSDDFPPKSFGGAGIITFILASGLQKAGHELYVITTTQEKANEGWRELEGLKIYDLYVDYPSRFASYVSLYNFPVIKKVERIVKEIQPDVIHAHNIHHYLSYGCLRVSGKYTDKVFLTTHDAMAFNYGKLVDFYNKKDMSVHEKFSYKVGFLQNLHTARKRYNPFRNLLIRWYLNNYPKRIFAISNRLKEALQQNNISNVSTIHYGIDSKNWEVSQTEIDLFSKKLNVQGKKVIFFGGRLSEAKGGKIMIDVLRDLVALNPDVVLLIAGTANDYSRYLLSYAGKLGIKDSIIFTGWLSPNDMKKAYSVCNVVVTPSVYFDAFNLFNIEAGAASKPVVGTCFGGTPEIIQDNVTGKIVNPHNIKMFGDALLSVLNDPAYAHKLGQAGHERVEKYFNLDQYVAITLAEYQK